MASQFDASEFVDDDFQTARAAQKGVGVAMATDPNRAPSREEVDSKVGQMHEKLAELKRVQQELDVSARCWKKHAGARSNSRPAGKRCYRTLPAALVSWMKQNSRPAATRSK